MKPVFEHETLIQIRPNTVFQVLHGTGLAVTINFFLWVARQGRWQASAFVVASDDGDSLLRGSQS